MTKTVKSTISRVISTKLTKGENAVVVASCGRSGSTMLMNSIAKSKLKIKPNLMKNVMCRAITKKAWNLENTEIKEGYVYKTHDLAKNLEYKKGVRYIYTFSNPIQVICSVIRKTKKSEDEWLVKHSKHMQSYNDSIAELVVRDALNVEENIKTWRQAEERENVMCVHLENIWRRQEEISKHVGFSVDLPEKRSRNSYGSFVTKKTREKIARTYEKAVRIVDNMKKKYE